MNELRSSRSGPHRGMVVRPSALRCRGSVRPTVDPRIPARGDFPSIGSLGCAKPLKHRYSRLASPSCYAATDIVGSNCAGGTKNYDVKGIE